MTRLKTYAQMAENVYKVPDARAAKEGLPAGWSIYSEALDWSGKATGGKDHGGMLGSGFKGCIYKSADEVVVAFKGTGGGHGFKDLLADAKLAVGVIPREATPAKDLLLRALQIAPKDRITLVGHSLGGGLCQVVGHWYKVKFATFNAPPMMGCIQKAKVNIFKPEQMIRAIGASSGAGAGGRNYRAKLDVVSSRRTSVAGHYGEVITKAIPGVSDPMSAHKMGPFLSYLQRSSDGQADPFHKSV